MIKAGDKVTFKPQWQDPGDEDIRYVAMADEDNGRVLIVADIPLPIKPTQIVCVEWLEHQPKTDPN